MFRWRASVCKAIGCHFRSNVLRHGQAMYVHHMLTTQRQRDDRVRAESCTALPLQSGPWSSPALGRAEPDP